MPAAELQKKYPHDKCLTITNYHVYVRLAMGKFWFSKIEWRCSVPCLNELDIVNKAVVASGDAHTVNLLNKLSTMFLLKHRHFYLH